MQLHYLTSRVHDCTAQKIIVQSDIGYDLNTICYTSKAISFESNETTFDEYIEHT
jgi:hypothetical protein